MPTRKKPVAANAANTPLSIMSDQQILNRVDTLMRASEESASFVASACYAVEVQAYEFELIRRSVAHIK